jgi:hypothetical protein
MIDRQSLAVAYDDKDRDKNKSNVIPFIFKKPFLQEIEEMDQEQQEQEKDLETKLIRLASYTPEIDDMIMAMEYWDQEWNKADPKKTKFKNLQDFISWSLSNTDQP